MRKIKIGDVFEIKTSKGKGYFQYVFKNKTIGELIRVFPKEFMEENVELQDIIRNMEYYFIHFPLEAAYKQGLVEFIDNYDVPESMVLPKKMRSKQVDKDGNLNSWQIVDYDTWQRKNVKELSYEEKNLSPWGAWNDTLLVERIEAEWTPEKW